MSHTVESLVNYLILVAIAVVLLVVSDIRWFALYAFMVIVGLICHFTGRLWKLLHVSHAVTNGKILVLARKVGVSDADYDAVAANMRQTDPTWATIERYNKAL